MTVMCTNPDQVFALSNDRGTSRSGSRDPGTRLVSSRFLRGALCCICAVLTVAVSAAGASRQWDSIGFSGGGASEIWTDGVVTQMVNDRDFVINDGLLIQTDDTTQLLGFTSVSDLRTGVYVMVTGFLEGNTVAATSVLLYDGLGDPVVKEGTVSRVVDDLSFEMHDGTLVLVHAWTVLDGFGHISELEAGDTIHVLGFDVDGAVLADFVSRTNTMEISIQGFVEAVFPPAELVLSGGFQVIVDPSTELIGFSELGDLVPGDEVLIFGLDGPGAFLAYSIELLPDSPPPVQLVGSVDEVLDAERFTLDTGEIVTTDATTQLIGFGDVLDLRENDIVMVGGRWVGDELLASWVELVTPAPEPIELTGLIAFLEPPNAFALDDLVRYEVDEETEWIGLGGYDDLAVGDELRVLAQPGLGGPSMTALEVERLGEAGPTWITREGWVAEVLDPSTVLLTDGVTLDIRPDAELHAFDDVLELGAGDRVWIGAYTTDDPKYLDVLRLELLERPGQQVEFVSVVQSIAPWHSRFTTTNGYVNFIHSNTVFLNIGGLPDLVEGDWVAVLGTAGTDPQNPQHVTVDIVELTDGENGGGGGGGGGSGGGGLRMSIDGMVTDIRQDGSFEVDSALAVDTDDLTEWRGSLVAFDDLMLNMPVRCELILEDDETMLAVWVEGFDSPQPGLVEIAGYVLEIDLSESRLRFETGEWILWDELTAVEGDVESFDDVVAGMHVFARAVDLGENSYFALEVLAQEQINDVAALGFGDESVHEALVVLRDGSSAAEVAARHGAVVTGTIPGVLVHLFYWDEAIDSIVLQDVLDDEDVVVIEPNRLFSDPESDPESIRRRAIAIDREATSDTFNDQDAVMKAGLDLAHDRTLGQGTLVAVIDTGVDPLHPLLRHRIADGGYDFVDEDDEPWETTDEVDQDDDGEVDESAGHGTFVSSLVLLAAPATSIVPFRVLNDDGRGSTFDISRALILAINRGVDVVNMSFSYPERSRVLDRILMEASDRGVILVSGAGNNGSAALPFPASDTRVLAVAAIDTGGRLADFSNRGVEVLLGAPGVDVYSAGLDAQFGTWSGTSMAAPLVSGTAALLRSANPYLTPNQVEAALVQGAADASPEDDIELTLRADTALGLVPDSP